MRVKLSIAVALGFALLAVGATSASEITFDEWKRTVKKKPRLDDLVGGCLESASPSSRNGVRACTVAIQRGAKEVTATKQLIEEIKRTDLFSPKTKAEHIANFNDFIRTTYTMISISYSGRGISRASGAKGKATADCNKAEEFGRASKRPHYKQYVSRCRAGLK